MAKIVVVMPYNYVTLDRENLEVAASVVQLSQSKIVGKVQYARFQCQEASIRVTTTGDEPTAAGHVGEVFGALTVFEVWGRGALRKMKMIRETSATARVEITYMGEK